MTVRQPPMIVYIFAILFYYRLPYYVDRDIYICTCVPLNIIEEVLLIYIDEAAAETFAMCIMLRSNLGRLRTLLVPFCPALIPLSADGAARPFSRTPASANSEVALSSRKTGLRKKSHERFRPVRGTQTHRHTDTRRRTVGADVEVESDNERERESRGIPTLARGRANGR